MTLGHAYCTYFDSGYLSRGLALIQSLREHGDEAEVWVLALDAAAADYLHEAALPGVQVLSIGELEAARPDLLAVKADRSRMEYYFTMTPLLVQEVMRRSPDGTTVIYLDSDLFFFDKPTLAIDALGEGSVGIIAHRYQPRLQKRLAKYGTYNVGWVGFRDDERGRACLAWWGDRTVEWCRDTPSGDGRYADQGYLNRFPELFGGVVALTPLGLNLAPWNTAGHRITEDGTGVQVDGDPVVFFHFNGLKRTARWWITSQLVYGAPMGRVLRERVYTPYVRELERQDALVAASPLVPGRDIARRGTGLRGAAFRALRGVLSAIAVATGNAIRAR